MRQNAKQKNVTEKYDKKLAFKLKVKYDADV